MFAFRAWQRDARAYPLHPAWKTLLVGFTSLLAFGSFLAWWVSVRQGNVPVGAQEEHWVTFHWLRADRGMRGSMGEIYGDSSAKHL